MVMDEATFLGTAGTAIGLVMAVSMLVQARRLSRLGSACEVSIPVRVLALAGYAVWLAYGIAISDIPLILVDLAGVAGAALVLHVTVSLRRRTACAIA
jgi:uncharacterized protein with PQ loop repeat